MINYDEHICDRSERWAEHDSHGIFLTYVCESCIKHKLAKYDPSVFDYNAQEERAIECGESFEEI